MSNEVIKMPNNIVTAIRVDDEGQLWFFSKRPVQFVSEFEQTFPARLKFYRKGVSFFLEISGKATIMNSAMDVNVMKDTAKSIHEKPVLIKMTMTNVEYVEPEEKKKNKLEVMLENGYNWLLRTVAFHRNSKSALARLPHSSI